MYRIIKEDGTEIGVADQLNYIKVSKNGSYVLCGEGEATGIAHNGEPYSLMGTEGIDGLDKVTCTFTEYSAEIQAAQSINSISFVTLAENDMVDATTASEHIDMFAEWVENVNYKTGQIRQYGGKLYKCVQDHTSSAEWTPDKSASLWDEIADPAIEFPDWSQPVGAHDAYKLGDKVTHNGKKWVSNTDNNVWEPGVFGWDEYVEDEAQ